MTSKFIRRLKKHRTRLRKMGLPTNPMMPSRRWSEVLAGARALEEIREHMMERMLADIENERPLAPWIDGPPSFESPWRMGGGYAEIDPDAHIINLKIIKHPLDRDEGDSELPLTTPRKPSTFGE